MSEQYYNIDEINIILLDILEEIILGIIDGTYENESDANLILLVTPLLLAVSMGTQIGDSLPCPETALVIESADDDDQHHDVEEPTDIPTENIPQQEGDPAMEDVVEEGDSVIEDVAEEEAIIFVDMDCSNLPSGGDAPSSGSGPVEPTPNPEDGPVGDAVMLHVAVVSVEKIEPAKEQLVNDKREDSIGEEGPVAAAAAAPEKRDPPRRNRVSRGWKRIKRTFRALCCCCAAHENPDE